MIAEGERVAALWEESGDDSPGVLGEYIAQMGELVEGRS